MDIIAILGLISSITGIISFILYFVDKRKQTSGTSSPLRTQSQLLSDWRVWLVFTMFTVAALTLKISVQQITGIEGNNNDSNKVIISPK
jgi:uncharacterized membrane protein HdeD (DUF308 family)